MVLVLAAYDITRGVADKLGIGVHVHPMIDFDKAVFFGQTPTEWLQHHLYDPNVLSGWNVAFTLIYTSYFITPFALAGWLWARDRREYLRFAKRLVTLAIAGVATYILFPAAPPWMAADEGLLHDVHRTTVGRLEDHRRRHLGPLLRRPGARSTWSPRCPRCTRASRCWSRSSSGTACRGAGPARCCCSIRRRWR